MAIATLIAALWLAAHAASREVDLAQVSARLTAELNRLVNQRALVVLRRLESEDTSTSRWRPLSVASTWPLRGAAASPPRAGPAPQGRWPSRRAVHSRPR
jgi:hypothetical protein